MEISGRTRICAIIADPIQHVKTPQAINSRLGELDLDAKLIPVHVKSAGLAGVIDGFRHMENLAGFVVTVPHKTAVLEHCDELAPDARHIGAVNIVRRLSDGRLRGHILDGQGFVAGLRAADIEPAGKRAYLAGAGGAANAIAFALAAAGVTELTIANRTLARAEALIERLTTVHPDTAYRAGTRDPIGHDLVVNATSLGLRADDPLPLDAERLTPDQTVAEIIMKPAETPLLAAAAARGCRTHAGRPMLEHQLTLMLQILGFTHPG